MGRVGLVWFGLVEALFFDRSRFHCNKVTRNEAPTVVDLSQKHCYRQPPRGENRSLFSSRQTVGRDDD